MVVEKFTITSDGWQTCVCGMDELDTCLSDGSYVEPTTDSDWQYHYVCINCGRVVDDNQNVILTVSREFMKTHGPTF